MYVQPNFYESKSSSSRRDKDKDSDLSLDDLSMSPRQQQPGKPRPRRSSKEKILASDLRALRRVEKSGQKIVESLHSHTSAPTNNNNSTHYFVRETSTSTPIADRSRPSLSAQEINDYADPRSENGKLYSNVFPSHILEALQTDVGEDIANQHNSVSVLMADIVGFTKWCASVSPVTIIQCLSAYFQILDDIAETLGVYKVRTERNNMSLQHYYIFIYLLIYARPSEETQK